LSLIKWVDFPLLGDERGSLIALEQNKEIPFDIKRVYYIFGTKESVQRGFHAHKKLKQIAVCVAGHCKIILDDGIDRIEATLDSPAKGLFIVESVWHEMHGFSNDCVLLVLASDYYDESDYIRDYTEFKGLHQ
tara:strand:- start:21933 stop:22331 length:399 start_codon:yes stop_codon:yes gene_type:complete